MVGEVSSLAHERRDDPVESAALETKSLLVGAEREEVLCSLWDDVLLKLGGEKERSDE